MLAVCWEYMGLWIGAERLSCDVIVRVSGGIVRRELFGVEALALLM